MMTDREHKKRGVPKQRVIDGRGANAAIWAMASVLLEIAKGVPRDGSATRRSNECKEDVNDEEK